MAKRVTGRVNKSKLIRDYVAANPNADHAEIVGWMKEQGHSCSTQLISNVKTRMGTKTKKRPKKRGRPKGSRNKTVAASPVSPGAELKAFETALIEAKKLVDRTGGSIETVRRALNALEKLQ